MKRLILFLIRTRLGLKKFEYFRFNNQRLDDIYYFNDNGLIKMCSMLGYKEYASGVSLNWLLDDECKKSIEKVVFQKGAEL